MHVNGRIIDVLDCANTISFDLFTSGRNVKNDLYDILSVPSSE